MATEQNDIRAGHVVHVFPTATNVKFTHKGYEISLHAQGEETLVSDHNGRAVFVTPYTTAESVWHAVNWINNHA